MPCDQLVAFVTGGASGIGKETVLLLVQNGYRVAIADRNQVLGAKLVEEIGQEKAIFIRLDISSAESVQGAIDKVHDTYGRLDVACHAAGIGGPFCPAEEVPLDGFKLTSEVDFVGTFIVNQALVRYWLAQEARLLFVNKDIGDVYQRGALCNVSSITGLLANNYMLALSSAKHGASGVSKNFALEMATKGIRVNTVNPGVIYTPIMQAEGIDINAVREYLKTQAMPRFGHPQEVANAIFFLLSDEASFITGSEYRIDGGLSAK